MSHLRDFNVEPVQTLGSLYPVKFHAVGSAPRLYEAVRCAFERQCDHMAYRGLYGARGILADDRVEVRPAETLHHTLYLMQGCNLGGHSGQPRLLIHPSVFVEALGDPSIRYLTEYLRPSHFVEQRLRVTAFIPEHAWMRVLFPERAVTEGPDTLVAGMSSLRYPVETVRYFDIAGVL